MSKPFVAETPDIRTESVGAELKLNFLKSQKWVHQAPQKAEEEGSKQRQLSERSEQAPPSSSSPTDTQSLNIFFQSREQFDNPLLWESFTHENHNWFRVESSKIRVLNHHWHISWS